MTTSIEKPVQCHLWTAVNIEPADLYNNFDVVVIFVDESHLMRSLWKCKECNQLYFYEFYEQIDRQRGQDSQYSTFIPVKTSADIKVLRNSSSIELNGFVPSLRDDFPANAKERRIYWAGR
jgi:hypothetical protein